MSFENARSFNMISSLHIKRFATYYKTLCVNKISLTINKIQVENIWSRRYTQHVLLGELLWYPTPFNYTF